MIDFITGTDTGVGKTLVAAAWVRRLRALGVMAAGLKPVETGCTYDDKHDLVAADGTLLNASASWVPPFVVAPYRFVLPVAPPVAAEAAGIDLRLDDLVEAVHAARRYADHLVVEGAGGALTPVAVDGLGLDLAKRLDASVVLVAKDALGTQSQTLAVLECARARGLVVQAVLLSNADGSDTTAQKNVEMIRSYGDVAVVDFIPRLEGDENRRIEQVADWLAQRELPVGPRT